MLKMLKSKPDCAMKERKATVMADTAGKILYLNDFWGYSNEAQPFESFEVTDLPWLIEELVDNEVLLSGVESKLFWGDEMFQLVVDGQEMEPIAVEDILYADGKGITYEGAKKIFMTLP